MQLQHKKYNREPCWPLTVLGTPPTGHCAACQGLATLRWKESRQGTDHALDPEARSSPRQPTSFSQAP